MDSPLAPLPSGGRDLCLRTPFPPAFIKLSLSPPFPPSQKGKGARGLGQPLHNHQPIPAIIHYVDCDLALRVGLDRAGDSDESNLSASGWRCISARRAPFLLPFAIRQTVFTVLRHPRCSARRVVIALRYRQPGASYRSALPASVSRLRESQALACEFLSRQVENPLTMC